MGMIRPVCSRSPSRSTMGFAIERFRPDASALPKKT